MIILSVEDPHTALIVDLSCLGAVCVLQVRTQTSAQGQIQTDTDTADGFLILSEITYLVILISDGIWLQFP